MRGRKPGCSAIISCGLRVASPPGTSLAWGGGTQVAVGTATTAFALDLALRGLTSGLGVTLMIKTNAATPNAIWVLCHLVSEPLWVSRSS